MQYTADQSCIQHIPSSIGFLILEEHKMFGHKWLAMLSMNVFIISGFRCIFVTSRKTSRSDDRKPSEITQENSFPLFPSSMQNLFDIDPQGGSTSGLHLKNRYFVLTQNLIIKYYSAEISHVI